MSAFDSLSKAADSAEMLIKDAGVKGMMITDVEFASKEVDQILIHMRSSVHAFAADSVTLPAKDGLAKAKAVQVSAMGLIEEYYYRRWGLVISSCLISLLALGLYIKIRSLDKKQPEN